jgi:hypothetical protein
MNKQVKHIRNILLEMKNACTRQAVTHNAVTHQAVTHKE